MMGNYLKALVFISIMYLYTLSPFIHICFTTIGTLFNVNNTVPRSFNEYNGKTSKIIYLSDGERLELTDKIVGIRAYDCVQQYLTIMLMIPVLVIVGIRNIFLNLLNL